MSVMKEQGVFQLQSEYQPSGDPTGNQSFLWGKKWYA